MRKILYSPGYGAGWTSWHRSSAKEEQLFMLEYKPFIEILELGKKITSSDEEKFLDEFIKRFGEEDTPYMGGVHKLVIKEVPDGARVRISEYDGYESVEAEGEYESWL